MLIYAAQPQRTLMVHSLGKERELRVRVETISRRFMKPFAAPWPGSSCAEPEDAQTILAWPHSGFHVHDAVLVPDGDVAFALRVAPYCARNPVTLDRVEYDAS
jgi:hypothetical protein